MLNISVFPEWGEVYRQCQGQAQWCFRHFEEASEWQRRHLTLIVLGKSRGAKKERIDKLTIGSVNTNKTVVFASDILSRRPGRTASSSSSARVCLYRDHYLAKFLLVLLRAISGECILRRSEQLPDAFVKGETLCKTPRPRQPFRHRTRFATLIGPYLPGRRIEW